MRIIDRITYNRLIAIILNFILSVIKIIAPATGKELEDKNPIPPVPKPPLRRRPLFPREEGDKNNE